MSSTPPYTLVICICDAYEDAWYPFFSLFRKYWRTLEGPIVLNTETKSYQHEGFDIISPQLYKGLPNPQSIPWSKRLRQMLQNCVTTALVMLFLDDFYLRSPVNAERLNVCLRLMKQHENIANITLFPCPQPYTRLKDYPWIVKRAKKLHWLGYLFNLQAALWRTRRLNDFLRDHESPWYFERWSSLRALGYPDDFYAVVPINEECPVFDYDPTKHGMTQGRWRPETDELFTKEGLEVDTSIRGVMPADWRSPSRNATGS